MKKIAIVRRNGLGDLICACPLVQYLKNQGHRVTLFVDARNAPLLSFLSIADDHVVFPAQGNKYWNVLKTGLGNRKNRYDMAISAKTSPMKLMNFFLFSLGSKIRIAPADNSWHTCLLTHPIRFDKTLVCHQALKALKIFEPSWTRVPEPLFPEIRISDTIKAKYKPLNMKTPIVLISATTTHPSCRLSPAKYASILNRAYEDFSFTVLILGQECDKARAEEIRSQLQMETLIHFPRNFEEFMVLLDSCELFFVGDGGIAHMGAALGKEEIVMYGGINPEEWSPLGKKVKTHYHSEHVDFLSEDALYQTLVGGKWMK